MDSSRKKENWHQSSAQQRKGSNVCSTFFIYDLTFSHLDPFLDFSIFSCTVFENNSKCLISDFEIWHFPTLFVLLKLTCLVTMFKKLPKLPTFVHSKCKWSNVEWDFFCDFQTPCRVLSVFGVHCDRVGGRRLFTNDFTLTLWKFLMTPWVTFKVFAVQKQLSCLEDTKLF